MPHRSISIPTGTAYDVRTKGVPALSNALPTVPTSPPTEPYLLVTTGTKSDTSLHHVQQGGGACSCNVSGWFIVAALRCAACEALDDVKDHVARTCSKRPRIMVDVWVRTRATCHVPRATCHGPRATGYVHACLPLQTSHQAESLKARTCSLCPCLQTSR